MKNQINLIGGPFDGRLIDQPRWPARYFELPLFDERGFVAVTYEAMGRVLPNGAIGYRWVHDWWTVPDESAEMGRRIEYRRPLRVVRTVARTGAQVPSGAVSHDSFTAP